MAEISNLHEMEKGEGRENQEERMELTNEGDQNETEGRGNEEYENQGLHHETSMKNFEEETTLLPEDIWVYVVFPFLPFSSLNLVFRTCRKWSKLANCERFWENFVKKNFLPTPLPHPHKPYYFKPKTWKWVAQSKKPVPEASRANFTGVGSLENPTSLELLYEGEWINGKKSGVGVSVERWTREVYKGQFLNNMKHGQGCYYWSFGDSYQGKYVDNTRTGTGTYRWANGDLYVGDFLDQKKHGKGHYKWILGDQYIGSYILDIQNGFGIYSWSNGNKYVGDHVDDTRSGKGRFIEKTGHVIDGLWKKGLPLNPATGEFQIEHTLTLLNPKLRETLEEGWCTFVVTGKERFGQLFYMIAKTDDRPHGVCLTCVKKCLHLNGMELIDDKVIFGGNFYCDCGAGTRLGSTCHAKPIKS